MCLAVNNLCSFLCCNDIHLTHIYPAHKAPGGNEVHQQRGGYKVSGFQVICATTESSFLFDAAGRPSVVRRACPSLCQIKGQRLDGEATFLFIPVQPRERPINLEGTLSPGSRKGHSPQGEGSGDSLSLNLPGYVFFFPFSFFNS